jgi:hypothetical protein
MFIRAVRGGRGLDAPFSFLLKGEKDAGTIRQMGQLVVLPAARSGYSALTSIPRLSKIITWKLSTVTSCVVISK